MADPLVYFGSYQTAEVTTGNPATVNDSTAKNPLGILYRHNGAIWRYVKFDNGQGNVASAAAGVAHWFALSPSAGTFTVTSDQTDAIGTINTVAGIFGGVVTDGYYCWIQVGGTATAKTAASMGVGDSCVGGATDLTFSRINDTSAVTSVIFATAIGAKNTTAQTNLVLLRGLDW